MSWYKDGAYTDQALVIALLAEQAIEVATHSVGHSEQHEEELNRRYGSGASDRLQRLLDANRIGPKEGILLPACEWDGVQTILLGGSWPMDSTVDFEQQAVVEAMVEDMLASEIDNHDEQAAAFRRVEEIFGPDSTERTASFATGSHMTSLEIVLWAACEWDHCRKILTGEIDPDGDDPYGRNQPPAQPAPKTGDGLGELVKQIRQEIETVRVLKDDPEDVARTLADHVEELLTRLQP